ncbi:MAG: hypothetical protein ACKO0Z_14940 [Betaproteobacteria bacterium]
MADNYEVVYEAATPEPKHLLDRFNRIKQRYAHRDTRMQQVKSIRNGQMNNVAPDLFPDSGPWQQPIVANIIDIAARDTAEMLAPLPSFNCSNPTMTSDRSRENASLKTKVAQGYAAASDLQVQMYTAADQYITYGFLPFRVEIDYDRKMPIIRTIDPIGCYVETDRFNRVVCMFQRSLINRDELAAQFPEFADKIKTRKGIFDSREVEIIFYHDKDWDLVFMGGPEPLVLTKTKNPIGKVMVRQAARAGATDVPRGQFDDVIFVQLAKARLALLELQAAHESVNAPLAVPNDVPDVPFGPGATIRSNSPEKIRRVPVELPPAAFQERQQLERELQLGSRFPEARTGNVDNSIVTGKGVQALLGGYDSQIRAHQAIFARVFEEILALCFEVDEKVFPNERKNLRGSANGAPFEVEYTPAKTIKGDYTVDVTYGLMAGLDPNRWLVFALQARAEKMFSRDFMRREMPVDIDVEDEARKIDIEDLEEAAKQAIMGYAQSIPALASQGQDPSAPLQALAKVIEDRRKGKPLSDSVVEAFTPKPVEPTPPAPEAGLGGAPAGAEAGMLPEGMMPSV